MYTQISDTKCKGWSRTSFDDCKQKCINNDMPDSCDKGYGNIGCRISKWRDTKVNTGGPWIVHILGSQGMALLRNPTKQGLVLSR